MLLRMVMLIGLMCSASAPAFSNYCSAPSPPSCATRYGAFDDEDDFERCKRQMQSCRGEGETFLTCLQNEASRVHSEYDGAVDSFNRRARY